MTTIHEELLGSVREFLEAADAEPARGFVADIDWRMAERRLEPHSLPCLAHLAAAALAAKGKGRQLAGLLASKADMFCWGQTYSAAELGRDFIANYGWLEVFGTRGHFANERVAGGVLVLGPGVLYPDHCHEAEEIYLPLTGGTEWRMGGEPFRRRGAGEVVHHAPNVSHSMRTGRRPLLAFYLWRGGPLSARSTLAVAAAGD